MIYVAVISLFILILSIMVLLAFTDLNKTFLSLVYIPLSLFVSAGMYVAVEDNLGYATELRGEFSNIIVSGYHVRGERIYLVTEDKESPVFKFYYVIDTGTGLRQQLQNQEATMRSGGRILISKTGNGKSSEGNDDAVGPDDSGFTVKSIPTDKLLDK